MKKRKIKKKPIIILIGTILLILLFIFGINYINYRKSDKYKLISLGYNEKEIIIIENKIKNIDTLLHMKYNKKIPKLIKEKYFIEKNLKKYLSYAEKNENKKIKDMIAIVNIQKDKEEYEESKKANMNQKKLILVNKYHYLEENYEPSSLVNISLKNAYEGQQIQKEVNEEFQKMCEKAKEEDITLIVNLGYRSYEKQKKTYDYYEDSYGQTYADKIAARPGYSEHQTGLSLDILAKGTNRKNFEKSEAFKWLKENAYKYGFILRYPKDKEFLTGFTYEPWHYRYVGKKAASQIEKEKITLEEYCAFYMQ